MGWSNKIGLMSVYLFSAGGSAALILDQAVKTQILVHFAINLILDNIEQQ